MASPSGSRSAEPAPPLNAEERGPEFYKLKEEVMAKLFKQEVMAKLAAVRAPPTSATPGSSAAPAEAKNAPVAADSALASVRTMDEYDEYLCASAPTVAAAPTAPKPGASRVRRLVHSDRDPRRRPTPAASTPAAAPAGALMPEAKIERLSTKILQLQAEVAMLSGNTRTTVAEDPTPAAKRSPARARQQQTPTPMAATTPLRAESRSRSPLRNRASPAEGCGLWGARLLGHVPTRPRALEGAARESKENRAIPRDQEMDHSSAQRVAVLRYLFTPEEADAEGPAFYRELAEEVREECEKIGPISEVTPIEKHQQGIVCVKFKASRDAVECVKINDGRFFGGRRLAASLYDGKTELKASAATQGAGAQRAPNSNGEEVLTEFLAALVVRQRPRNLRKPAREDRAPSKGRSHSKAAIQKTPSKDRSRSTEKEPAPMPSPSKTPSFFGA